MKKMVLGISMSLVLFGFLVSPAAAATPQRSVPALGVFLASLGTPASVPMAKRPPIQGKSLCTATANCGTSSPISCSSNTSISSCSAADQNCGAGQRGFVTCDGITTQCPACPVDCDELEAQCGISCDPCSIKTFSCVPYRCRCNLIGCPQ